MANRMLNDDGEWEERARRRLERGDRPLEITTRVAVADYFASIGLSRARLFPAGRGDQDFLVPNDTAAGRAQNRRVEFIITSQ